MTKFNEGQLAYLERLIDFKGDDPMRGFEVLGDVRGTVWGDVRGDVWGDVRGDVRGTVCGNVRGDVFGTVGKG